MTSIDSLRALKEKYADLAKMTEFKATCQANISKHRDPIYPSQIGLEGTDSEFNRLFTELLNDPTINAMCVKKVKDLAIADYQAQKAALDAKIASYKAEG